MGWANVVQGAVGLYGASQQRKGAKAQGQMAQQGVDFAKGVYGDAQGNFAPYMQAGQTGLSGLSALAGGDYSGFMQSPDYLASQKAMQYGQEHGAAAKGRLFSGGFAADLAQANGNHAAGYLGNYRNSLMGLANMGQQSAGSLASIGGNTAGQVQRGLGAAGDARASGYNANAELGYGLGGLFSNYWNGRAPTNSTTGSVQAPNNIFRIEQQLDGTTRMTSVLEGLAYMQRQGDLGTERRKSNSLASLAADYASGGAPDYQGIAANGGNPLAFRKDAQGQEDRQLAELGQMAGYLAALPDEQTRASAYAGMLPKLGPISQRLGVPLPPAWSDQRLGELQAISQQFGGAKQQAAGVQSSFVDAQGRRMAIMRDGSVRELGQNAPNNQIIDTGDGFVGVNKGNLSAAPVMMGQSAPQSPQEAPQDVMGGLLALGAQPGVSITSGPRSPAHNAEVGGKGNGQNLGGTAMDYKVPPAQKAQFIALAQKGGFQAIDEGDHIHLQLPRSGQQLRSAPKAAAAKAPTELERRVQMAQEMGATPDQIKAMVVGGGPSGNAQSQKTSQANRIKMAQLETVQRQIDRLASAADSVGKNKMFDGGPLDQYALGWTAQGQEMEQSAAAILPVLTALTRVPGVGAQSDLESRLASLQLPSAKMHPEVNKAAVKALREYMADLKAAYQNIGGQPSQGESKTAPAKGGWSIQAVD